MLVSFAADQVLGFTLVAFRVMGIVMFGPLLGSQAIPGPIRALVGLGLAFAVFPAVPTDAATVPTDMVSLLLGIAGEIAIGAAIGLFMVLVFTGARLGGQIIGHQMGIGLGTVFSQMFEDNTSLTGQLYYWLALVIFVSIGGHVMLLGAVVGSFSRIPLMGVTLQLSAYKLVLLLTEQVFVIGFRIGAPVLVTLMLTMVGMGFIARTVPQMNIFVIGFPIRLTLGFLLSGASLLACAYLLEDAVVMGRDAIDRLLESFAGT